MGNATQLVLASVPGVIGAALLGVSDIGDLNLVEVISTLGLSTSLVLWFTWQSFRREERIANRVSTLEQFQQTELLTLIEKGHACSDRITHALEGLSVELRARPCMVEGCDCKR